MPVEKESADWRKGRRRVHFVTGDATRVADADGRQAGVAESGERRRIRTKMLLQEIYASAAGDGKRIKALYKAGYPATLAEALADEELMSGDLPRWPHELPSGGSLPGENAPLVFVPGRATPLSEDEALGVARRRRRRELIEQYAKTVGVPGAFDALVAAGLPPSVVKALSDPEVLIAELPTFDSRKVLVNFRFPGQLKMMADAASELAHSNFTAMTELLWWRYLQEAPIGPQQAEELMAEYLQSTVGQERQAERAKTEFRPRRK